MGLQELSNVAVLCASDMLKALLTEFLSPLREPLWILLSALPILHFLGCDAVPAAVMALGEALVSEEGLLYMVLTGKLEAGSTTFILVASSKYPLFRMAWRIHPVVLVPSPLLNVITPVTT